MVTSSHRMNNNIIRIPIDEEAHEKLRSIKKSLKPEKKVLGEIASEIMNNADVNGMSRAAKRRAVKKGANK